MGQDPKYKMDDIIGVAALVLLFIGMMAMTYYAALKPGPLGNQPPETDPDLYSTPNGNFPKESSYLEKSS